MDELPDEGIFFLDKTSEFAGGDDLDGNSRKKRAPLQGISRRRHPCKEDDRKSFPNATSKEAQRTAILPVCHKR